MGNIVVVGSSNTDLVVTTLHLPQPGETLLGNEINIHPGGKGANQVVATARANAKATFIAKVGKDDFGQKAIEGYKSDNINVDHIIIDPQHPSGIAVILVEESTGQNSIVVVGGANNFLSVGDIKNTESVIAAADTLLLQLEIPVDVVEFTLRIAKNNRVKTILNPAPAKELTDKLLRMVDIITPNESETKFLTGIEPDSEENIQKAACLLLKKVNEAVIITLGDRGAYFCEVNGDMGFIPSTKVEAVDSTAAGDVFNGYLAALLAGGSDLRNAISLANKAAAISVTRKGAQPSIPKLSEIID